MVAEKPTPPPIPKTRTRRQTLELESDELEEVNLIEEARGLIQQLIKTPVVDIFGKAIPHDPDLLELKASIRLQQLREKLGLPQMGYHQMKEVMGTIRQEIKNAGITK